MKTHPPAYFLLFFLLFCNAFWLYGQDKNSDDIVNSNRHFSPNFDGTKDTVFIPLNIQDDKIIEKWQVYILEKKEGNSFKTIKKIESENSKETKKSLKKFFKRIIEKKKNVDRPSSINWDGKDKNNKSVKDGVYYFKIVAYDETGNKGETAFTPFVLDNTPPVIENLFIDNIFSPNEDGRKELLHIKLKSIQVKKLDTLEVSVFNTEDKKVKKIIFNGDAFLKKKQFKFTWDGKDDDGQDCEEGNYEFRIQIKDLAGNVSELKKKQIALVRTFEKATITSSVKKFSPNNDNYLDLVVLRPKLSSEKNLQDWVINIYDENNTIVKSFFGENKLSKHLIFYGQKNDIALPDGVYNFIFKANFTSGNLIQSVVDQFIIDNTPPTISVNINQLSFNPNSESLGSQKLKILNRINFEEGSTYRGSILDEQHNVVYRYLFGGSISNEIFWDGKNSDGQVIPKKYFYHLQAKDDVGNKSSATSKPFTLVSEKLIIDVTSDKIVFSPGFDKLKNKKSKLKRDLVFTVTIPMEYEDLFVKGNILLSDSGNNPIASIPLGQNQKKATWMGIDSENRIFLDGKYHYQLEISFSTKEYKKSAKKTFYIDTTSPEIDVSIMTDIFSPNKDGNKDEFIVRNLLTESKVLPDKDNFKARILSSTGVVYKQFEWEGYSFPEDVIWQGDDQVHQLAPEGKYVYKIKATDFAGNATVLSTPFFILSRALPEIGIQINQQIVSRKNKKNQEPLLIATTLSTTNYLEKVSYSFYEKSEEKHYPIQTLEKYSSNLVIPNSVIDSLPSEKNEFFVFAKAHYHSGDIVETFSKKIYFDEQPPVVTFITTPNYFSPDNDGENETLNGYITIEENDKLASVRGLVYRKIDFQKGKKFKQNLINYYKNSLPFKTFDFEPKSKNQFEWDGLNKNGNLVESANDYLFFVLAKDRVGNVSIAMNEILVDVFVEKLTDGRLRLVVNSIYFKYNSDKMLGRYDSILDRIIKILNKFPDYKITIVGHTDSRGSEVYNKELSTKRAKRVYDYLVNNGISQTQLTFFGQGEGELVIKNEGLIYNTKKKLSGKQKKYFVEENYRKNRRVEFFLEKPKKKAE